MHNIEVDLVTGRKRWPGETLCLKKRPMGDEKAGFMGYSKFGLITKPGFPMQIYLRGERPQDDFLSTTIINSLEEFDQQGWMVD